MTNVRRDYNSAANYAISSDFIELIDELLEIDDETGCHNWGGSLYPDGYGRLKIKQEEYRVHRLVYSTMVEPIPDNLVIDHLCRNPSCCNPEHLEAVTSKENLLRGESPAARQARQTRCIRGHKLSGDNLYTDPRNKRYCLICRRQRDKNRRARKANS